MMMDEKDILSVNPFEGDFGEVNDRTLKDKMVTARKSGQCFLCEETISVGDRVRSRSDIFGGRIKHFRWCAKCCEAMALSWTDGGEAYESRYK